MLELEDFAKSQRTRVWKNFITDVFCAAEAKTDRCGQLEQRAPKRITRFDRSQWTAAGSFQGCAKYHESLKKKLLKRTKAGSDEKVLWGGQPETRKPGAKCERPEQRV